MASQQLTAIFGTMAFLGTVTLLPVVVGAALLARLIGEKRLAAALGKSLAWLFDGRGLATKLLLAAGIVVFGYGAVLIGFSLTSSERVLSPGEEKYFCEIDCHLAYALTSARMVDTLGAPSAEAKADGTFLVVSLRTRFDETTISNHRPKDFPLYPSPREISIVDEDGKIYSISAQGQAALEQTGGGGTPLTQWLRPGDSYSTDLVFDVPAQIRGARLYVRSQFVPTWLGRVVIGGEQSFLHRRTLHRLPALS